MSKKNTEMPDRRSGGYFLLPDCVMASVAWREASPLMVKLLLAICARHNGYNNGKISLSSREAAETIGTQNFRSIAAAFCEAELKGFIALEKDHRRGQRLAREYRLTFVGVRDHPATNDYLMWRPGDAGTRKKRTAPTAAETSLSAVVTAAETKLSAVVIAAETGESANISNVSADDASTHIFNHMGVSNSRSPSPLKLPGGRTGAIVLSAAPSTDELRSRVAAHCEQHGRGSQSRLAELANIPPGTFSRFLHHDGPLSQPARVRLTCNLPRAENEQRREKVTA